MSTCIAAVIIARHEAGQPTAADWPSVPPSQMAIWFDELAPICPSRLTLDVERRPRNALNVEIGAPTPRCMEQSPDGRGAAWLASGGSALAYAPCSLRGCPRAARKGGGK